MAAPMSELDDATLDELVDRLERAAEQLRSGDLAPTPRPPSSRTAPRSPRRPRPSSSAARARPRSEPLPGQDSLL